MPLETLSDAEHYLDGFINRERVVGFDYEKLGLERVRGLLEAIGSPHADLPAVHVTGSKGKGSVALASEVLLRAAGHRVGTFTSPHLVSWAERFRIDGRSVAEESLVRALRDMEPVLERRRRQPDECPSFFDVITALAFELFGRAGVDVGVFEVGLGGRLDSTNVVVPRVCVLTTVELEHTDKLGDTTEAIAREKAGIMKKGVPFLHGPLDAGAHAAVLAHAIATDVEVAEVPVRAVRATEQGIAFALDDGRRVECNVLGPHQAQNLALSVAACEVFLGRALAPGELAALRSLELPARLERLGDVVLDCAHTVGSARALREVLSARWPGRPWVLALSLNSDKQIGAILSELAAATRACVVTRAEPTRSLDPDELAGLARAAGIAQVEVCAEPRDAIERARELAGSEALVVATGSIYFAGAVRDALVDCARRAQERENQT